MFLADTHMHSTVSFDGHDSRRDMVYASRVDAKLDCICFTDHYDIINEKGEYCPHYDWKPARRQQMEAERLAGVLDGFELLYGIELGNAPADFDAAERVLKEPGLDFVIGSIHNASRALGGMDYYYVDYKARPELAAPHLKDYLDSMLELAGWGNFDSLGHIPYPMRYIHHRAGLSVSMNDYKGLVDEILRTAVDKGKAIEINTYRGRGTLEDYVPLVKRFRALGGELVTCGADAHRKEDVGKGLKNAYELLEECGFRYVTVFRQRKPSQIRL